MERKGREKEEERKVERRSRKKGEECKRWERKGRAE